MGKEVLVLGAKRYCFVKDDGERIEGTTIYYTEDMDYPYEDINMKGVFPMNVTNKNMDFFDKFPQLPGYYDMVFRNKPDKQGKPVAVPVEAKFLRPFTTAPELKVAK